jgi:putative hydrolase of the HAD superfamily
MPLIIFDLDDTLVDRTQAFRNWAEEFIRDRRLDPDVALARIEELDEEGMRPRSSFLQEMRQEFAVQDPVEDLVAAWWPAYLAFYRCDPETLHALLLLKNHGWRIGIATNGDWRQEEKIRVAGLDAYVDGWCVSELAGVAKPDRRIFGLVAERCDAELDGAWMVGDSAVADIAGAANAGIRSVWIARGRTWKSQHAFRPTLFADSVKQAVAAVLSSQ